MRVFFVGIASQKINSVIRFDAAYINVFKTTCEVEL